MKLMKKLISTILVLTVIISCLTVPAVFVKADGDENAVEYAKITASSFNASYPLENIYDGNLKSITSISVSGKEAGYGAWIKIDLGEAAVISGIAVRSRRDMDQESSRAGWILQVANKADFSDAVTVGEKPDAGPVNSDLEVNMTSKMPYRYIRVAKNAYFVISEFEVYLAPAVESGSSAYEDIAGTNIEDKINILSYLGIIEEVSPIEFGTKVLVDRGMAAKLICNMQNLKDGSPAQQIYADVPVDHQYAPYITHLYKSGFINPAENYNVDSNIRMIDFLKLVNYALGYKDILEVSDLKESGIIGVTNKLNLLSGVEYDSIYEPINKHQAAVILYNALNSNPMVVESIVEFLGEQAKDYGIDKSTTYMNEHFGLIRGEGIVKETPYTSLTGGVNKGTNHIMIDGISYKDLSGVLSKKIGRNVEFYYNEDKEIACAWEVDNNIIVIDECNLGTTTKETFIYYDENEKEYKARMKSGFDVIKNGVATLDWKLEHFHQDEATLTLIDNDDDFLYDVVLLDVPEIYVVQSAKQDSDEKITIVDVNTEGATIDGIKSLSVYRNGSVSKVDSLKPKDIAYVYCSDDKKVVKVEAYANVITGKVDMIDNYDVTVGGKAYALSNYYKVNKKDVEVGAGDNVSLALNGRGEVIWVFEGEFMTDDTVIAFICQAKGAEGFKAPKFKIYTLDGQFIYIDAADKIIIDDVTKKASSLNVADYVEKIYKIRIVDNKIKEMVTPTTENEDWVMTYDDSTKLGYGFYSNGSGIFNSNIMTLPLSQSTKLFVIPRDGMLLTDPLSDDESLYSVKAASSAFINGVKLSVFSLKTEFYESDEFGYPSFGMMYVPDTGYAGIPVLKVPSSPSMIINRVSHVLGDEGEETYSLKGFNLSTGAEQSIVLAAGVTDVYKSGEIQQNEGTTFLDGTTDLLKPSSFTDAINEYIISVNDLKCGDIVRYELVNNKAVAVEKIYDANNSSSTTLDGWYYGTTYSVDSINAHYRLVNGTVDKIGDDKLTVNIKDGIKRVFEVGSATIYEKNEKEFVKVKTLQAVSNMQKGKNVVFVTTSGTLRSIVFY